MNPVLRCPVRLSNGVIPPYKYPLSLVDGGRISGPVTNDQLSSIYDG
jgi:hypothetical protein